MNASLDNSILYYRDAYWLIHGKADLDTAHRAIILARANGRTYTMSDKDGNEVQASLVGGLHLETTSGDKVDWQLGAADKPIVIKKMAAFLTSFSRVLSIEPYQNVGLNYTDYRVTCFSERTGKEFVVRARVVERLYCECKVVEGCE